MGLFGFGKKKEKPAPAAVTKPDPAPETPETLYKNGMTKYALRDYAVAFALFQKAAEQGHGKALLMCVEMYQRGEGVEKDLRRALKLAEKAKAQGVPGAEALRADVARDFVLSDGGRTKPAVKIAAPAPVAKAEAPKPAPVPRPTQAETDGPQSGDEDYQKGEERRKAKNWDGVIAAWTKAAEQGHRDALKKLTGLYAGDFTVWGFRNKESRAKYVDYDKAIHWGTAAMERGVDTAAAIMGAYEKKGLLEEAIAFGEKAVSQGFDAEWKLMYLCLDFGRYKDAMAWSRKYDEKKGTDEAKERFEQEMEKRVAQAKQAEEAFNKGIAAYEEKDYPQALSLLEKAAGLGSSTAMFNCGLMYFNGLGTAVDKAKALMWYEKAAYKGYADAQLNYATMYVADDCTAVDFDKALIWAEKAARQGHSKAQDLVGLIYEQLFRDGVAAYKEKDYPKALELFEKVAAHEGDATAQYNCGVMYDNGEGTAVDKAKALMWYEKAAEQGHVTAQFNCGCMYHHGEGTAANKDKAVYWHSKAAEQGHEESKKYMVMEEGIKRLSAEEGIKRISNYKK